MITTRVSVLLSGVFVLMQIGFANPENINNKTEAESIADNKSACLTVRDFGAVGDGKADDTIAFQRAVDSGGGDILIPGGIYRLTESIVVDLDSNGPMSIVGQGTARIIMTGAGPAFKLIGTHDGTASPMTVKENVWRNQRMPIICGLEIIGTHQQACGIEAAGTMHAVFSKMLIRKALHGIQLTRRNRNVIISDCHIYENRGVGIYLDHVNLHQINVGNSHISYNSGGGIVQRAGDVRNLQIGNCDIEANMDEDSRKAGSQKSPPAANVLIDATGGTIGEIAITGCTIQHSHNASNSANICIIGKGLERDYAQGELRGGNIAITGNILSDVQVNIHLRSVRGATIVGNTVWKGYLHDFLVEDSAGIVIGSNMFDRNPRYHYGDGASANRGLLFRNCTDCSLTGLQINNVWRKEGAISLEKCRRFNISGCGINNCDNAGIFMDDVQSTIVTGCVVSDTRRESGKTVAVLIKEGRGNFVSNNLFVGRLEIAPGSAKVENNLKK